MGRGPASLLVAAPVIASLFAVARPASAQATDTTLGPARVSWLGRPGDASGSGGTTVAPPALEALRLAMLDHAPPIGPAFGGAMCGNAPETAGVATGAAGFGTQRAAAVALVPRLTLFGFSRTGCAVDSALGAGLVYEQPIAQNVSFTFGLGALYQPLGVILPSQEAQLQNRVQPSARVAVVVKRPGGRAYWVGLDVLRPSVSFGGIF